MMLLQFKRRHAIISILEPRYRDRTVLIACYKLMERNRIKIMKGAYAGEYFISGVVASAYPIQTNGRINCYAVPLAQLERI